jgi:hypothetical protein
MDGHRVRERERERERETGSRKKRFAIITPGQRTRGQKI